MFREAMGKPLKIEAPREIGQNYQLLLPITYYFPAGYIDDIVYHYTVRNGSHSRTRHTFEEDIHIINVSQQVLSNIISRLKGGPYSKADFEKALMIQKARNFIRIMFQHNRKDYLPEIKSDIKRLNLKEPDLEQNLRTLDSALYRFYKRAQHFLTIILRSLRG